MTNDEQAFAEWMRVRGLEIPKAEIAFLATRALGHAAQLIAAKLAQEFVVTPKLIQDLELKVQEEFPDMVQADVEDALRAVLVTRKNERDW